MTLSIAVIYANLNAKAVLCNMAPDNSLRFDVYKYDDEMVSLVPIPNSSAYLMMLCEIIEATLLFNFVIFGGAAVVAGGLALTFTISMFYFAPKNPGYCLNSS